MIQATGAARPQERSQRMATKPWCFHPIPWDKWRGTTRFCYNKISVERDGEWYCKIHDPERIAAKCEITGQPLVVQS